MEYPKRCRKTRNVKQQKPNNFFFYLDKFDPKMWRRRLGKDRKNEKGFNLNGRNNLYIINVVNVW